ncbi:hypothetical protein O181_124020 [Austropuccinia psidii MF-1]|uniref:Uncharacterized protein n=1 Tax=Austropuccinia psidii MF-1 TaxID=1389203 RepID=A0A9Q3KSB4_9BASI|nr:hypothetical protein [Austropuccinia psidii MF-1]
MARHHTHVYPFTWCSFAYSEVNNTINQLNRIIGPTYGLCQKEACVLVSAVVTTRILHGSIIWYTNRNKRAVGKQLNTWLFKAISLSTGMMKQTPTPFLKLFGGIRDLSRQHIKLTHNYFHSKMTAPIDDVYQTLIWRELTTTHCSHLSPLKDFLKKQSFLQQHSTWAETLVPFPTTHGPAESQT